MGSAGSDGVISGGGTGAGGSAGFRACVESVCTGGLNGGGIGRGGFRNNRQDTRPGVSSRTTSMTRIPALIVAPA
jgi:hypothetical protein